MKVPRFFVKNTQMADGNVKIVGDDAFHISRALRMAVGEHIVVCDESGNEYDCRLDIFGDDYVCAKIIESRMSSSEPCFTAHVYQGLPKGDKLDMIIQKAVECGASGLTTFESDFCIAKVKLDSEDKKLERRARISLEAAKQCGRGTVPEIRRTISFEKMILEASEYDMVLFCYEGEGTLPIGRYLESEDFKALTSEKSKLPKIAIVVGPEGGFSVKEANAAAKAGFKMCGLGKRILRTETAATFALCCLVYSLELS